MDSNERVEEIRRRWAALGPDDPWGQDVEVIYAALAQAEREHADAMFKAGEIVGDLTKRLAQAERKRDEHAIYQQNSVAFATFKKVVDERDAARAEVERLNQALADLANESVSADHVDKLEAALARVQAALKREEDLIKHVTCVCAASYVAGLSLGEVRAALEGRG